MSSVGEQLRSAREARNLTVEQVAEMTKMRADHVRAVEEGNYSVFPAPVYIRGFIRTYCSLLKLDRGPVLKALESEIGVETRFAEAPIGTRHPQGVLDLATLQLSKIGWKKSGLIAAVLVVLVAGIVGAYAWRRSQSSDPLKNLEPGVYRSAGSNVETLPLPQVQPR